jgi:hypothetical protein
MKSQPTRETINREVRISAGDRILEGEISVPKTATGIVLLVTLIVVLMAAAMIVFVFLTINHL